MRVIQGRILGNLSLREGTNILDKLGGGSNKAYKLLIYMIFYV